MGIKNQILVENGDLVLIDKDKKPEIHDKIFTGRVALKGNKITS